MFLVKTIPADLSKIYIPAREEGRTTGSKVAGFCSGRFSREKFVLFVMSVPRILNTWKLPTLTFLDHLASFALNSLTFDFQMFLATIMSCFECCTVQNCSCLTVKSYLILNVVLDKKIEERTLELRHRRVIFDTKKVTAMFPVTVQVMQRYCKQDHFSFSLGRNHDTDITCVLGRREIV